MARVLGAPGLGLCLLLAAGASAETFEVTTAEDDGAGSLREAIGLANASDVGLPHTIAFTLPADSTITPNTDLPALEKDVVFDATGAPGLTLDTAVLTVDGVDAGVVDLDMVAGDILIGEDDTFTFTANESFEVSSAIADVPLEAGPGMLVKDGTAALTLTGDNIGFSGGISIEEGTLIGNATSLPQAIANDGALVFDQDGDDTYTGVVTGSGTLEKAGTGDLTLTGANDYTGGTTITAGTLIVDEASSLPVDGGVVDDAALMFDQGDGPGEFAGDISGTGSVTKTGAEDLLLSGTNSYSGGTTVAMGSLIGDTAALQGDVTIASGTTLMFEQAAGAGTFAGSITGDGAVEKSGPDDVRMTGTNDYTGGTTVAEGRLIVTTNSLPGAPEPTTIDPGATLVFDQGFDGTYDGDLTGGGDLEKRGSGTLGLSGASTVARTDVTSGTLDVTGSLTSPIFMLAAPGTLSGTGTVTGDVTAFGAVSPAGEPEGTLNVDGNLAFESGSRFVVDVNAMDGGDLLAATGTATIDPGALLVLDLAPGDYSGGTTVTILDASSLAGGMFDEGEAFAFLDRDVAYTGGMVTVTLMGAADFSTFQGTSNQQAVAGALDALDMDPDFEEFFDNVDTLLESEAAPVLDALSGEGISASTTARQALAERFQRTLHRRMRSILFERDEAWPYRPPPGPPSRRTGGPTDVAATPRWADDEIGLGTWLDLYGILGSLDGDGNSADADYGLAGSTLGLDYRLGDHGLVGLAAGYARTHLEVDDRATDGDADTVQGAVYAAWATPVVYAGVSGRYAWSSSETERDIDVGDLSPTARGDFDSHDYGLRAELALRAFEARDVAFEPLAAFDWSRLTRKGFDESGAGALGLDVDDEVIDSTQLQLGARVRALFEIDEETVLAPELRAFWLHEFGDTERRVEAALGGAPFTVEGAEASRDGALVGTGWAVSIGRNARATLDYDLRIDADRLEHVAGIALRGRF